MDRTLRAHVADLEARIKQLSAELMEGARQRPERNRLEAEIRVAELALTHYREALKLEEQLLGRK